MARLIICRDCGEHRRHRARGVCSRCYHRRKRAATIDELPMVQVGPGLEASPLAYGMTYRQLDHWTRRGYLRLENPTPGSGLRRIWPEEEKAVARTMLRLTEAGLLPEVAARIARGQRELAPGIRIVLDEEICVDLQDRETVEARWDYEDNERWEHLAAADPERND